MRRSSFYRFASLAVMGGMLFQATGCATEQFFTIVQTVFLGVTAAGAVAILQNL